MDQSSVIEQLGFAHFLPEGISASGSLSTQTPSDLHDQTFDTVVIGGGILGISMAYHTLKLAGIQNKPHRLLLVDRNVLAGEATSLSGGHIGIGYGADHAWLTQAVGRDATDDLYRRSILALHFLRNAARYFEDSYGLTLIQAPAIAHGVIDRSTHPFAEREAAAIDSLIFCDRTLDRIPDFRRERLARGGLSLAPVKGIDDFIPCEMRGRDLPGNYRSGFYNAGEFAVNSAMLRIMLVDLLTETSYGDGARLSIQEHLCVTSVDAGRGVIRCRAGDAREITFRANQILLAGVDGSLLCDALKPAGPVFHSLIGVADAPPHRSWRDFRAAVHGTDAAYSYMTLWNNQDNASQPAGPFLFGSGDFTPSQTLSTEDKVAFLNAQAKKVLGAELSLQSLSLGGNLVYAQDGTFQFEQQGRILRVGDLGGKALSASWKAGKLAAETARDPDGEAACLFRQLTHRLPGFDPVALAHDTPPYLLPPHLEHHSRFANNP